ncbi:MAG: CPBP family intramembrane glutamate endopeptidase, partial [Comamonas sp.]
LALQHMWLPGIGSGVLGAAWMVSVAQLAPDGLAPGDPVQMLPLWAKLLYGGITEELLLRWGALNLLLFALWRGFQPEGGEPLQRLVWLAIVLSGL